MKKIIFFLFIISVTNAQWEYETATIIDKGRKEIGIFSPFRVGLQNGMELSINKFIIMPTISIKQSRSSFNKWSMAQKLQLSYPSLGMKWLQSPLGNELGDPNMFALISPEFNIPQMISIYGELIATAGSNHKGRLTLNAGAGFSINGKSLSDEATIDLPIAYPRLSVYFNGLLLKLGGEYYRQINEKLFYVVDYDMFLMPNDKGRYAFEHKSALIWSKNKNFRVLLGYKLIAGEYPFGSQAHLLPSLDFQFGW